jgi:hypothetical protein
MLLGGSFFLLYCLAQHLQHWFGNRALHLCELFQSFAAIERFSLSLVLR